LFFIASEILFMSESINWADTCSCESQWQCMDCTDLLVCLSLNHWSVANRNVTVTSLFFRVV